MNISNKYVVVTRLQEEKKEGFQTVEVQDSFVCKGQVLHLPETPLFMGNQQVAVGDVIMFAKYSPDTHELELEGQKVKFVSIQDILAIA